MRRPGRRGSNAVEFALLMPLFVALLVGTMEYGWYFGQEATLGNAVRQGARAGAVAQAGQDPVARAQHATAQVLQEAGFTGTVHVEAAVDGSAPDQLLVVSAWAPYHPLAGLMPAPVRMQSRSAVRLESQP